jgi:hypothetical protein
MRGRPCRYHLIGKLPVLLSASAVDDYNGTCSTNCSCAYADCDRQSVWAPIEPHHGLRAILRTNLRSYGITKSTAAERPISNAQNRSPRQSMTDASSPSHSGHNVQAVIRFPPICNFSRQGNCSGEGDDPTEPWEASRRPGGRSAPQRAVSFDLEVSAHQ